MTFRYVQYLHFMYAEVAWVLVSSGTQNQPQIILDPDYLPDYLSVSYAYDIMNVQYTVYNNNICSRHNFFMDIDKGMSSFLGSFDRCNLYIRNLNVVYEIKQSGITSNSLN